LPLFEPIRFFQLLACRQQAAPAWIYPIIPPKPSTPSKAATPRTPKTSPKKATSPPDDQTSIVSNSTPVDPLDPLPKRKHLQFFLQRPLPQQHEAIEGNPCYLNSLNDWKNTLEDEEDLEEENTVLLSSLPHITNLVNHARNYYQSLSQEVSRLKATNTQLKEENNRLSTAPSPKHKDPAVSQLRELEQRYQDLASTHNELIGEHRRAIEATQEAVNTHAFDAEDFQGKIKDWELVGKALLRSPYNEETLLVDPIAAEKHAKDLIQALAASIEQNKRNRANTAENRARMSGMFQGEISAENCQTIWNQVPEELRARRKEPAPTNSVDLLHALKHLATSDCNHPEQAANALGDHTGTQAWDASLEQMEELSSHVCPTEATLINPSSQLFRASDVPKFTSTANYDGFRSSLLSFFQSNDSPSPRQFPQALLRILGTFEDPTAQVAAQGWNVRPLCHHNSWEITYQNFIRALDEKFQSATILQDTKIEWMKVKPKPEEKPSDFFNRFEAASTKLKSVQNRLRAPELSDTLMTERLLLVLPRYIVDDARVSAARAGTMLELETPQALRRLFEVTWTYLPRPAAVGHNTKSNYQTANARLTTTHSPALQAKDPKTYACGFHGNYDTQPAVPMNLRGSIFPNPRDSSQNQENETRKQRCAAIPVCVNCRRPRDQHQTIGSQFKPITLQASARRALANHTHEETPGQLLLEAAPSPA
jgi:hypothetical protein